LFLRISDSRDIYDKYIFGQSNQSVRLVQSTRPDPSYQFKLLIMTSRQGRRRRRDYVEYLNHLYDSNLESSDDDDEAVESVAVELQSAESVEVNIVIRLFIVRGFVD
jgi:hypothetical protein